MKESSIAAKVAGFNGQNTVRVQQGKDLIWIHFIVADTNPLKNACIPPILILWIGIRPAPLEM